MMMRIRSISPPGIRVQMTLWYTVVSAGLVLIFGITFYVSFQNLLASSFDTTLRLRSQQVAEGISYRNHQVMVSNIVHELPELDAPVAIAEGDPRAPSSAQTDEGLGDKYINQAILNGSILIRVLDLHGQILYRTPTFKGLGMPAASIRQPLQGVPWYGTITGANHQPIRFYSTRVVVGRQVIGIIQIGQSLAGLNSTLQHILLALLITTPFILILCGIGSYWLAGRAFLPMHRLMHMAREIGVSDLHQRVPIPRARDEVYDLSVIFNEMVGRLEQSFAQQRRFVADASHELRTPVAVIRNMTEVALAQPASKEDYRQALQEINAESERLGRLINELLSLARIDEGQIKLDVEPVRLDLLAADVVESLASLAQEHNIVLQTQTLDTATVLGDAARLIQIIMSLVDNAIIYTNAGGTVTVSVETCATHAHVSVCDTGIGIAEEDIKHIFERFYRADPARSKAMGGSGLGLAIVDWAVRAHRGTITVNSQLGRGSTFMVTLPLAPITT